jgi:demethoxyubiquinone hydroxylase (CLK1/Coq7/Cat5 family)
MMMKAITICAVSVAAGPKVQRIETGPIRPTSKTCHKHKHGDVVENKNEYSDYVVCCEDTTGDLGAITVYHGQKADPSICSEHKRQLDHAVESGPVVVIV